MAVELRRRHPQRGQRAPPEAGARRSGDKGRRAYRPIVTLGIGQLKLYPSANRKLSGRHWPEIARCPPASSPSSSPAGPAAGKRESPDRASRSRAPWRSRRRRAAKRRRGSAGEDKPIEAAAPARTCRSARKFGSKPVPPRGPLKSRAPGPDLHPSSFRLAPSSLTLHGFRPFTDHRLLNHSIT